MNTRNLLYTFFVSSCLLLLSNFLLAQKIIQLYTAGKMPDYKPRKGAIDTIHYQSEFSAKDTFILQPAPEPEIPSLTIYRPVKEKHVRTGIIVCSGGSYFGLADGVEGIPAAKKLAAEGFVAFLLDYRMPRENMMINKAIGPLQDAEAAIRYVRQHYKEYNIDAHHVGIMGFSAGGHLVSTLATHFRKCYIDNPDSINLRPDFMVLVYPVISFADSLTHEESRNRLIGDTITPDKIREFSNELQVTRETPPAFITHAIDDREVTVKNSLYFAAALEQHNVAVKLFLYAKGGHGFGIYNRTASQQWIDECITWIKEGKWSQTFKALPSPLGHITGR